MTEQADRLEIVSAERIAGELTKLMLTPDPARGIDLLVQTGVADEVLPEVSRLRMEADEHHRHKDVYQHSLTVLRQAIELEPRYGLDGDLTVRLAALLHDIGKPKTRSLLPDGRVAFHLHEVVGAKLARRRLTALRFPNDVVRDVSQLVELHLRFHGYGEGEWTDSAVRRYVRDAGPLLTRLHVLTRADCTTRNRAKAHAAGPRLRRPGAAHRRAQRAGGAGQDPAGARRQRHHAHPRPAPRPAGGPGLRLPAGAADRREGELGRERATQELLRWAAAEGIVPPPAGPDPEPDED